MNFDNSTSSNQGAESFEMAKVKRAYIINGVQLWITGNNEQEVADKYADLKYLGMEASGRPRKKHNFEAFALENWAYISQTVAKNTALDYERYLRNQLLPHFGKMNVEDITWREIQAFFNKYPDKSYSTVHKWRIVLSRILQIAVGDELIQHDPTKDKRLSHTKKKTARPVPGKEAYRGLLSKVRSLSQHHERLYMALIGYTGLRRGEVLALEWEDVLFEADQIKVKQSIDIERTNLDKPGRIKRPKTESGVRTIPLVKPLKALLLEHQSGDRFIVTDQETGRPVHSKSAFNHLWKNIGRQIDLGPYTSHSYRHALCSTLLANGVDIKTTQTILGHAQPSTTLNVYAHAMPNKIQEAGLIFIDTMST